MDFFSVYKAWLNCRRRKRATPQAQCYEAYLLDNLVETAHALTSGSWQPRILRPVQSGADFLGYIVRPNYLLVRRRVIGNLWERLARFQQQWITGSNEQGWTIRLLPEPREQLRSVLASYFGHFQHASHYRLVRRIFTRFPWLSCLFSLLGDRLVPLWQPIDVSGYKSQQRFFRRTFPNAQIDIQCGFFFDRLPASAVHHQQPGTIRCSVSKVTVRQQGYLKRGLRRRAVEVIALPPFSQTGVRLCEPLS